jgi:hypothetical protein
MEPPTISKKREYLVKFIQSKGFEPLGRGSEEPDIDDLWDIIDENGWVEPTNISCKSIYDIIYVNSRGMFHKIAFPASQIRENNKITSSYYVNGQKHNLYGPAIVEIKNGKIVKEEFWEYGKQVERERTQSISFKYVEEFLSKSGEKENPFDEIQGYDVISQNIAGSLFPYKKDHTTVHKHLIKFGLPFDTKEEAEENKNKGLFNLNQLYFHNVELSDEYVLKCANEKEWGVTGKLRLYGYDLTNSRTIVLVNLDILRKDEKDLGVIIMPGSYSFIGTGKVVKQGDQQLIDDRENPQLLRFIQKITSDVAVDKIEELNYSFNQGEISVMIDDGKGGEELYSYEYEYFDHRVKFVEYNKILRNLGEMTSLKTLNIWVSYAEYELTFLDNVVLPNLKNFYIREPCGKSVKNFLEMNPSIDSFQTEFGIIENMLILPNNVLYITFNEACELIKEEPYEDELIDFENFIGPMRKSVSFYDKEVHPLYLKIVEKVTTRYKEYQSYLKFKRYPRKL